MHCLLWCHIIVPLSCCLLPTTGPIIEILQGGQGELSAAIFQELSREWPVQSKPRTALSTWVLAPATSRSHLEQLACRSCVLVIPSSCSSTPHLTSSGSAVLQGSGDFQSLRLQLTAGLDQDGNETLSYSDDVVTLPKDHTTRTGDPRCAAQLAAPVLEAGNWLGIGSAYSWLLCMLLSQPHSSEYA